MHFLFSPQVQVHIRSPYCSFGVKYSKGRRILPLAFSVAMPLILQNLLLSDRNLVGSSVFCPSWSPSRLPTFISSSFLYPLLFLSYPFGFPSSHKHLWCALGVHTHDTTVKDVYSQQTHPLEFTKNRWSSANKLKCTACFNLGWFFWGRIEKFQISKFQNTITSYVCFTYYSKCLICKINMFGVCTKRWECGGKCYANSEGKLNFVLCAWK